MISIVRTVLHICSIFGLVIAGTMLIPATERLRLRSLGPDDAQAFRAMSDEPAITDAIHFLPTPFTLADARPLIAGSGDGRDCFGASGCGTVPR